MDSSLIGVMVAGLAVIVGAIMQFFTIRSSRKSTEEALNAAQKNTSETLKTSLTTARATIQADKMKHYVDKLADDLAKYMSNSYFVDSGYRAAMAGNKPWPGEHWEEVKLEDQLYSRILLHLNPEDPFDKEVLDGLQALRDGSSKVIWIERRDALVRSAQASFAHKWQETLPR